MLPYLPVDLADPVDRLAAVRQRVRALRGPHEPEAGGSLTTPAELGAFPSGVAGACALGLPPAPAPDRHRHHQRARPARDALRPRAAGVAMLPYVPIADRVRIGVAMFSYRDTLTFGITGDYDTTPDLQVLADGIGASMAELLGLARAAG